MTGRTWLLMRALMAIVLMAGFYVLAIGTAGLLLFFAYAQVVYSKVQLVKLVIVCVIGAIAILWSLIPRRDTFTAPGEKLVLRGGTRSVLFEELNALAGGERAELDLGLPAVLPLL